MIHQLKDLYNKILEIKQYYPKNTFIFVELDEYLILINKDNNPQYGRFKDHYKLDNLSGISSIKENYYLIQIPVERKQALLKYASLKEDKLLVLKIKENQTFVKETVNVEKSQKLINKQNFINTIKQDNEID